MNIYTARMGYRGDDRLDITSRTQDLLGKPLAPPWSLVEPMIALRRANRLTEAKWREYLVQYRRVLRASYRVNRAAWEALLLLPEVTLLCFCADPQRCHRVPAAELLVLASNRRAQYLGERPAKSVRQMSLALNGEGT